MAKDGFYFMLPLVAISLIFLWLFQHSGNWTYIYIFGGLFLLAALVSLFFRDPEPKNSRR